VVQSRSPIIEIEEVEASDPNEVVKARRRREQFDRNIAWLHAHGQGIYPRHRGKVICVAGQELFVADTAKEAVARAAAAHPDDEGRFTRYIPKVKANRIYAAER
jgi:hypothetical protein